MRPESRAESSLGPRGRVGEVCQPVRLNECYQLAVERVELSINEFEGSSQSGEPASEGIWKLNSGFVPKVVLDFGPSMLDHATDLDLYRCRCQECGSVADHVNAVEKGLEVDTPVPEAMNVQEAALVGARCLWEQILEPRRSWIDTASERGDDPDPDQVLHLRTGTPQTL